MLTTMMLLYLSHVAFATSASGLYIALIDILSKVLTPIGALLAAMGVAHYAKANSDGDGPGKRKATMEMASGVATILVSVVLVASKETFAALIAN